MSEYKTNQRIDYEKMEQLTRELLGIIADTDLEDSDLALFAEKVEASKSFFDSNAATMFRDAARAAVRKFSIEDNPSVIELVRVAQIPEHNATCMKVADKLISHKIKQLFAN